MTDDDDLKPEYDLDYSKGRRNPYYAMLTEGGYSPPRPPDLGAVHSDPELMGGTPVFVGTQVPVKSLFDSLAGGYPLADFLGQHPSVTHEQALAVLAWSLRSLESQTLAPARAA